MLQNTSLSKRLLHSILTVSFYLETPHLEMISLIHRTPVLHHLQDSKKTALNSGTETNTVHICTVYSVFASTNRDTKE